MVLIGHFPARETASARLDEMPVPARVSRGAVQAENGACECLRHPLFPDSFLSHEQKRLGDFVLLQKGLQDLNAAKMTDDVTKEKHQPPPLFFLRFLPRRHRSRFYESGVGTFSPGGGILGGPPHEIQASPGRAG